jgi:hypothetical protein
MATNFPTSVDSLVNPVSNDSLNTPSHSAQHTNANDAIEAIETYLLNGGQGLTLIKKQTVGTAVTTVTVPDVFSAAYVNYRVLYTGGVASTLGQALLTRGASGTGNNIVFAGEYVDTSGTRTGLGSGAGAHLVIGVTGTSQMTCTFDISQPFLSDLTGYACIGFGWGTGFGGMTNTAGSDAQSISSTGLIILPNSGTITGGTIYVYGYGIGQ